ncbi:MAG TPA: hypothetical protein VGM56_28300 [Byssovorax sp.]|jgi:hypothetical protein
MGRRGAFALLARLGVAAIASLAAGVSACGGSSGAGAGGCGPTDLVDATGACATVGIPDCADVFIDADGVCRPSAEKCAPGELPKFAEGCVAVSIPGCAKGFVEADGLCHPKNEKCGSGTYAVPQKGCVSIDGDAGCGSGAWGAIPDGAGNVYVDPSYAGGSSDGSKTRPFTTLAAGLARVAAGGRVALAAGDYPEHAVIDQAIELVGRCPSMVTLSGDDGDAHAPKTLDVTAGPTTIRGVRIAGDGMGVHVDHAEVTIDGVFIDAPKVTGVYADHRATVTVTSTFIQGARSFAPFPYDSGIGVDADGGSHVTLRDVSVFDSVDAGISASADGTTLDATDVLVEKSPHEGVVVVFGATGTLEDIAIVHVSDEAVSLEESTLTLSDFLIDDTYGDGFFDGDAIDAVNPVPIVIPPQTPVAPLPLHATVTRGAFTKTHGPAVYGSDHGTTIEVSDVLSTDQDGGEPQFLMIDGAAGKITDAAFVRGRVGGLAAVDYGDEKGTTTLAAERVLIEDVGHINDMGDDGEGVVIDGARTIVSLDELFVLRAHVAGVLANTSGKVTITRSLISDTAKGNGVLGGHVVMNIADGITAKGTDLTVTGTRVEGCTRAGLLFDACTGALSSTVSTENQFGLVFEGQTKPKLDALSTFDDNTMQGVVDDGTLPVPSGPPIAPQ